MKRYSYLILLGLLSLVCVTAPTQADNQATRAYIISLQNRPANDLLPTVQALLRDEDKATIFENELIVTTTEARYQQIAEVVAQLDTAPRNLVFEVRNNTSGQQHNRQQGFSGGIKRERIAIDTGKPIPEDSGGIIIEKDGLAYSQGQRSQHYSTRGSQHIRALEGHPAYIASGQAVPYRSRDAFGGSTTEFVDVVKGFYVSARIVGQRVFLDISTANDKLSSEGSRYGKNIDTERLNTTVSGNLGEWISLGGVTLQSRSQGQDITSQNQRRYSTLGDLSLMVKVLD